MRKGKIPVDLALQKDVINALLCEIVNRPEITDKMAKKFKIDGGTQSVDLYATYKAFREQGYTEAGAFQYLQEIYDTKEDKHG